MATTPNNNPNGNPPPGSLGQRPRLVSGARVNCYVNGKLIGRVTGINFTSSTPHKEARSVDDPTVQEFMPTSLGVTGTISILRLIADGGAQGIGITVPQSLISLQKYFTLVLVERDTDTTIFRMEYAIAHNESWVVVAKTLMSGTVTFSGIAWGNELGS